MLVRRLLLCLAVAFLPACSGAPRALGPGYESSPRPPPEELDGVDTSDLTPRERDEWSRLVTTLYAPCPDQAVTVAECVKQERACIACTPAALLLAQVIREGLGGAPAEEAFAARFGPVVKPIDPRSSPARGPENAPVTVVVWSDFECPHCRIAMPILDKAFEELSPGVRLVHKFYPLDFHPHAEPAARAAFAAKEQGRYWEMEKLLFDHQHALEAADLDGYAKELGLDLVRFHRDMDGDAARDAIARDKEDAKAAGLSGTPFVVIDGRVFDAQYFRLDQDLVPWLKLELELRRKGPATVTR